MRFHATLELHGRTATGIAVPPEVVEALGAGRRPAVSVTLNGHTYRTTVAPRGREFLLPVSAENRRAAGLGPGDAVDVEIVADTAAREVDVPDDLAAALASAPDARTAYDALSFTHRKEWVRWIEEAKKAETRATRVTKTVEALRSGKKTH